MKSRKRLAVMMIAGLLAAVTAGCRGNAPVNSTAVQPTDGTSEASGNQNQRDFAAEDEGSPVRGGSNTMVETNSRLFFKYENGKSGSAFWCIDKKTGEASLLYEIGKERTNSLFWYYGGSLYFDCAPAPDSGSVERIGLYRLKVGEDSPQRLTDLSALPSLLYVSDGVLYVKGYGMEQIYRLKEDGTLGDPLLPDETIYGKMPEGAEDLYRESLPAIVERCGYMAVKRDGILVIADEDGGNVREVPEVTDLSNLVFDTNGFYSVVLNQEGESEICYYALDSLKKEALMTADSPILLQLYDGSLYYAESNKGDPFRMENRFYSVDVDKSGGQGQDDSTEPRMVAALKAEPGTSGFYGFYGNFYVADDHIYHQKIENYGIYIAKTPVFADSAEDDETLNPVLYESRIGELGLVEAVQKDLPCVCGEKTASRYYVETLRMDGDTRAAAAMNEVLSDAAEDKIRYGEGMAASQDESWVHSEDYSPFTLQYQIGGITYLDDRYCSIEMDGYEYTGGSHGMPFKDYFLFDRETGKRLGLSDILNTSEEELKAMVGRYFGEYAKRTGFTFETPEELEVTVAGRTNYQSPFYLTDDGVVFYLSPYEIAPYAAGFPRVTVPYGELELNITLSGQKR